jgi:hypothetical protein
MLTISVFVILPRGMEHLLVTVLSSPPIMALLQMGTVVDNPLDYYGGRLTQQERKATLTEQLLADADLTHLRKKRYGKLQVRASCVVQRYVGLCPVMVLATNG